jgi:hypothetical protein
MGLDLAIERLYATGWSGLDSQGCVYDPSGRPYPTIERVRRELADAGYTLVISEVPEFDCCRAQWRDASDNVSGAVVGQSAEEAAVFALAQCRHISVGLDQ